MNKLPIAKRAQILAMLCEGASMGSVSRLTGTSINSVSKLLVDAPSASTSGQQPDAHYRLAGEACLDPRRQRRPTPDERAGVFFCPPRRGQRRSPRSARF